MNYQQFIFKSYLFDAVSKQLSLQYSYDNELNFTETFTFDFDFAAYDPAALDRAFQQLFFVAGVSYYKAFLVPTIRVEAGQIDAKLAAFLSQTYERGLGEFFYVNRLDPRTSIEFPVTTTEPLNMLSISGNGQLVGLGGGKDSLVSVELLRANENLATWSLGHEKQLSPLVERVGLPHLWVEREWDKQLLGLNEQGAYNGHVPISAVFACVGTVVAILSGRRDTVVSNEQSANEPTLSYQDVSINHQYSKSQEFERSYQELLQANFGDDLRYYSLLRPLSELRIAELFSTHGFDKYHDVFSSCNRAFTHDSPGLFWDGTCPKCAFVFLALAPFVDQAKLQDLFGGKNLLLDETLGSTYRQLLGIEGDKPLECVGEVRESRAAMRLAQAIYPELSRYEFELPADYDFRVHASYEMPEEVWASIQSRV
ncbi:MAG: endonuclease domain-containing protein [Candidatus Saccharimonadales bacterium]